MKEQEPSGHPTRESWQNFLEEERFQDDSDSALKHLKECESCQSEVIALLGGQYQLIETLKSGYISEPAPPEKETICSRNEELWDYALWLKRSLETKKINNESFPDTFKQLESHMEECDRCISKLQSMQKQIRHLGLK